MITGIQVLAFIGWMFLAWLTVSTIIAAITYARMMRVPSSDDAGPLGVALLMGIAWPMIAWQWFIEQNFFDEG